MLQQEFSSMFWGFFGGGGGGGFGLYFFCCIAGIIKDTGLKYIFCHCAQLLRGLPKAEVRRTRNAIHLSPGCSTPRWTSNQFRFSHRLRTSSCQADRHRNWLSWRTGQNKTKQANNKPISHINHFIFPL